MTSLQTFLTHVKTEAEFWRRQISDDHPSLSDPRVRLWQALHDLEHFAGVGLREVGKESHLQPPHSLS